MLDLAHLNDQQLRAVKLVDKPLLILAGAGSGKTRVITYKVAYLLEQNLYKPNQILALTFTKKAATEMTERIKRLLGVDLSGMFVGTFHAFGAYLLRKYGHYVGLDRSFSIYDAEDQQNLIKTIIKDGLVDQTVRPSAVLSKITQAKLAGYGPDSYFRNSYGDYFDEIVSKVYREYQRRLKALNAVDFSDLLLLTLQLFDQHPYVLSGVSNRFRYVLVDEYQDTNTLQYQIVYKIVREHRNICVVGDEDQSIYSWRGATIENIQRFLKDFPEHEIIKLERNYRSTEVILEAANQVISKNPNRIEKRLWTDLKGGDKIKVVEASSPYEEALFVLKELEAYKDDLDSVAILYRVNALSRVFEEVFVRFGVPYRLVGGVGFYQRMEIKDILAYLKFLNNLKDEVSLLRIINTPARKIGARTIEKFREYAQRAHLSLGEFIWYLSLDAYDPDLLLTFVSKDFKEILDNMLEDKWLGKYRSFFEKLGKLIAASYNEDVKTLITDLIKLIGYSDWIRKVSSSQEEADSRLDNIKELLAVADKEKYQGREGLQAFLEDVSLMEQASKEAGGDSKGRVNLMTVHAAKGLEFKTVFIVGAEEGLFPHSRSFDDPAQMQEERRLFYVAITRAKRHLYITYSTMRNGSPSMPSNYIEDIDEELIERIG